MIPFNRPFIRVGWKKKVVKKNLDKEKRRRRKLSACNNFRFRDWCTCLVICKGAFPIASALNADPDISIARLKRPAKDGKTINGPTLSRSRYLHARQILSFSFHSIIIDRVSRRVFPSASPSAEKWSSYPRFLVSFLACKKGLFFPDDFTRKSNVSSGGETCAVFFLRKVDFIAIFNGNRFRVTKESRASDRMKDLFHLRDSQTSGQRIQFCLIQLVSFFVVCTIIFICKINQISDCTSCLF